MELTPDGLATGIIGAIVIVGAVGTYLRSLKNQAQQPSPLIAGIGGGFVDREQMERLIQEVAGIRKAFESAIASMSDRKQTDILDKLDSIADKLKPK